MPAPTAWSRSRHFRGIVGDIADEHDEDAHQVRKLEEASIWPMRESIWKTSSTRPASHWRPKTPTRSRYARRLVVSLLGRLPQRGEM